MRETIDTIGWFRIALVIVIVFGYILGKDLALNHNRKTKEVKEQQAKKEVYYESVITKRNSGC